MRLFDVISVTLSVMNASPELRSFWDLGILLGFPATDVQALVPVQHATGIAGVLWFVTQGQVHFSTVCQGM